MELLVNMIRQIIGSIIGTVRTVESGHGGTFPNRTKSTKELAGPLFGGSTSSIMDFVRFGSVSKVDRNGVGFGFHL